MKKTLISLFAAAMIACAPKETTTTDTMESEAVPVTGTAATTETAAGPGATSDFATKAAADGLMEVRLGGRRRRRAVRTVAVPEPLRVAHAVAGGIARGESRGRV